MKAKSGLSRGVAAKLVGAAGDVLGAVPAAAWGLSRPLTRALVEATVVIFVAFVVGLGLGGIPPKVTALSATAAVARDSDGPALVRVSRTAAAAEPAALARGIYFGWLAGSRSRFLLAGAPCAGDASPQVAELHGGDLLPSRVLGASAVSSFQAPLDAGRELPVTALSSPALAGLFADYNESSADAGVTMERLSFSGLRARCRSWRESDNDLGSAGVLRLAATQLPANQALEAHVLPLPDRTPLLALLLMWNRTPGTIVLDALHYAPRDAATGSITAVSGTFDHYDELAARMLALDPDSVAMAAWRISADDLALVLEPGGIALIGIDRSSFFTSRPRVSGSAQLIYLSYPVIDHHPLAGRAGGNGHGGLEDNGRTGTGRGSDPGAAQRLAMTSPLFARWSFSGHR